MPGRNTVARRSGAGQDGTTASGHHCEDANHDGSHPNSGPAGTGHEVLLQVIPQRVLWGRQKVVLSVSYLPDDA